MPRWGHPLLPLSAHGVLAAAMRKSARNPPGTATLRPRVGEDTTRSARPICEPLTSRATS